LEFLGSFRPDGTPHAKKGAATPKTPGAFALFTKDNFRTVKAENPHLAHGELMKILGQMYKATKQQPIEI
jgi:hypothetical protein